MVAGADAPRVLESIFVAQKRDDESASVLLFTGMPTIENLRVNQNHFFGQCGDFNP